MLTMFESAQVETTMTPEEARALTDRINATAGELWRLMLESYERGAWRALGYRSWREYAEGEFDISQSRAYRLMDQARVIRALEEAAGDFSPRGEIVTERDARDLKAKLPAVTAAVRERVEAGEEPEEAVRAVVEEHREERKAERREKEAAARTPAVESATVAAEIDEGGFDIETELTHALQDIDRLTAENEELRRLLESTDTGADLMAWREKYQRLEGRLQQEITTCNEAKKQAKYQGDLLAKIRKTLGVDKNSHILPRIEAGQL